MFSKIYDPLVQNILQSISPPISQVLPGPTLPLSNEEYEIYVAFLSQSCEELITDNHLLYLVKMSFDKCLEKVQGEELLALSEKEDMYLNFVMYCTFKYSQLYEEEEFEKHKVELQEYYEATDDETLFLGKIELIVGKAMTTQESPFSCLQTHCHTFSPNVQTKLSNLLKFIIGHSLTYLLPPQKIFGLCLKQTLDRYHITNPAVHQLADQFIDVNCPQTQKKLSQITQIMDEIMNMSS